MDLNPTPENQEVTQQSSATDTVVPQQQPKQPSSSGGLMHKLMPFISLLLFGALIGAGVWYYQEQRLQTAQNNQATLETKVASLETQLQTVTLDDEQDEVDPVSTISTDIVTGQVTTGEDDSEGNAITKFEILVKAGTVDELWVEYGLDISSLDKKTEITTQELGLGEEGTYGSFVLTIADSTLEPGKTYFYRAAAKQDGATIYGGVASFASLK